MSGRPGVRLVRLAAASAAPAFYALWIRPRLLAWGATTEEITRTYPGDKLVPDPDGGATMATILPALPERVWPWLVQMGGDRAGWYSWDWLDSNGEPSADRIVPEWQNLEVGQHLKGPTRAFHHADTPVPEPAHSGRRGHVTWVGAVVDAP